MTEEKEIKNWIEERQKGSDLMCKLLNRNKELEKENEELKAQLEKLKCCFNCSHKEDCVIEDYHNVCVKWEKEE